MTEQEKDALAAEYVLGTLDAREAAAVAREMASDAGLAAAVAAWEARLAPLVALAPPEAPPPDLWARIEAALAPPARATRMLRRALPLRRLRRQRVRRGRRSAQAQ